MLEEDTMMGGDDTAATPAAPSEDTDMQEAPEQGEDTSMGGGMESEPSEGGEETM